MKRIMKRDGKIILTGDKDFWVADQIFQLSGCLYHNSASKY